MRIHSIFGMVFAGMIIFSCGASNAGVSKVDIGLTVTGPIDQAVHQAETMVEPIAAQDWGVILHKEFPEIDMTDIQGPQIGVTRHFMINKPETISITVSVGYLKPDRASDAQRIAMFVAKRVNAELTTRLSKGESSTSPN